MKIGHGPATVIGAANPFEPPLGGSQVNGRRKSGHLPKSVEATLFAREGVAISLVLFARLFCCPFRGEVLKGKLLRVRITNRVCAGVIARALVFAAAFGMTLGTVHAASASARSARDQAAPPGTGRIVTDEVGRRVTIPADVRRIVTLAPNLTETVYALGLEDRLAGDTNYCDTPAAAKSKPHVGDPQNPSLEAIVALHPDLVLATTSINRLETADALAHLGIPVYTTDSPTVRGMLDSVTHMAGAIGAEAQGATLVANLAKPAGRAACTTRGPAARARSVRGVGRSADHHRAKYIYRGRACDLRVRNPWCCQSKTGRT